MPIIFIMSSWRKLKRALRKMLRELQESAFTLRICQV